MEVWDGLSYVRDTESNRAPAGYDYAEAVYQIQRTQREVNHTSSGQIELNRLEIIVNRGLIDDNATIISNNVILIGANSNDISDNVTSISNNATAISNNATAISNNTTAISNNVTDISDNATGISDNATDITNLTVTVGINTNNINTNTTNTATNTDAIRTTLSNNESSTVIKCTPVYIDGSGFKIAKADSSITTRVIGLAFEDITTSGDIQTIGIVAATTNDWDNVTGDTGGLIPNTLYYLSETVSGRLKTNAPTSGYVAPIGIAISSTQLKIEILNTILL